MLRGTIRRCNMLLLFSKGSYNFDVVVYDGRYYLITWFDRARNTLYNIESERTWLTALKKNHQMKSPLKHDRCI